MRQVRIHGPGDARVDEVETPEAGPRDAVVRVTACGICGTDLRYVRLGGLAGPTGRPMPLGHELSAVVESVGAEVDAVAPGDRVVLHPTAEGNMVGNGGREGGFADLLLVRNAAAGESLFAIPEGLDPDLAALAEPLGVGMNAVDKLGARPGERIAVFGAGAIGQAAVATLADRGIDDIVSIDLSARRLEIARALGARTTIDASSEDVWTRLRELHGTKPVLGVNMCATDAFVEASGAPSVITDILAQAGPEARLSVVALHDQEVSVNFLFVMIKQLTIRGAMEYPADFGAALDLLARRDLRPMITHSFALDDFGDALATARDAARAGKVLVRPA